MSGVTKAAALRGSPWPSLILIVIFLGGVVWPLFAALGRSLLTFDLSSLNLIFFKILGRSFVLSAAQAAASAILAVAIGIFLGMLLVFSSTRPMRFLSRLTRALGHLAFNLPTVTLALMLLELGSRHTWLPRSGWLLIVWSHVLMNVLFVAASTEARARRWLAAEGLELFETAAMLGARGLTLYRQVFAPLWFEECRNYLPLIFMWSFSAFSTVLILGGGPLYSTPEVLLFYSLKNDFDTSRMLVLSLVQLITASTLAAWVLKSSTHNAVDSAPLMPRPSRLCERRNVIVLGLLIFIFAAWPYYQLLWSGVAIVMTGVGPPEAFVPALLNSIALLLASILLAYVLLRMLFLADSKLRQFFTYGLGLSSTVLMAAWLLRSWDEWSSKRALALQVLIAAFALVLLKLPLLAYWVERRLRSLALETVETARLMGASDRQILAQIAWPSSRDLCSRVLFLVGLSALGEIAIVNILLPNTEVLATLSQRLAFRYDFSVSAWILFSMTMATLIGLALDRKIKCNNLYA